VFAAVCLFYLPGRFGPRSVRSRRETGKGGVAFPPSWDSRRIEGDTDHPETEVSAVADTPIERARYFLKDSVRKKIDFLQTDQHRGIAPPPVEKPFDPAARRIELVAPGTWRGVGPIDLETAMCRRRSRRRFADRPLSTDELSFLLWATQGIRRRLNAATALRVVPSAGARHSFETYVAVLNVQDVEPAFYRYLPLEHQLLFEFREDEPRAKIARAAMDQGFVAEGAVVFFWTTIPYRMEWRYALAAHRVIAIDVGHVGQNLYLACEAIGAGTCAVGAYDQGLMDRLLRVDGRDEFTIYLAPVGKIVAGDE
jgi:SagB-type dehydrogenase family enzyme